MKNKYCIKNNKCVKNNKCMKNNNCVKNIVPLSVLLVLFICGCGQKLPEGLPKLKPCSVTLVQEGKPLANATVDLLLEEGETKWNISGMSDEQGKVIFMTHALYKGVPEGKYKVIVTKRENGTKDAKGYLPIYSIVEKKFTDPASTPLKIEVNNKGGEATLDLGKPVKIQVDRLEPASNAKG